MTVCPACKHAFSPPAGEFPHRCPECRVLVLGPYCELAWIGGGGMGDVYRAREPQMGDRVVAIKIPRIGVDTELVQRRFEREIAASARLQHENAVRAYYRGEESGRPYLVMEFVSGSKLSEVIWRDHPLAPRRVARIVLGLARGLAHAERLGVVNRDIKPANVFLTRPDEIPKLLDYGLALITDRQEEVTRDGSLLGTPNYTAPEQFRDPHGVSLAADVYSLGCTAYCCLTGHPPFPGKGPDEVYRLHAGAIRPSVREVRPDVPEAFDRLIQAMLAAEPQRRPSPQVIVKTLEDILPRLSDQAPRLPSAAGQRPIDVVCPGCQACYHLSPATAGQRVRCPNRLCGAVIDVPGGEEAVVSPAAAPNPDDQITNFKEGRPVEEDSLGPGVPEGMAPAGAGPAGEEPPVSFAAAKIAEVPEDEVSILPAAAIVLPGEGGDDFGDRGDEIAGPGAGGHAPTDAGAPPLPSPPLIPSLPAVVPEPPVQRPGRSGADVTAALDGEITPATAEPAPVRPAPARRRRRQRRVRNLRVAALAALGMLAVAAGVLLYLHPPEWSSGADPRWAAVTDLVAQHKWSTASRKLEEFESDFPDDPRVRQVPFFRDLCAAGPEIYSTTGDPEQGLALVQQVFKDHRDNPAYADYCVDLYQALAFLIDSRFLPEATRARDPRRLDRARAAFDLLKTVGQAISEAWAEERTAETAGQIERTARVVEQSLARDRILARLKQLQQRDPEVRADEHYAAVEKEFAAWPALRADKELLDLLESAYQAESWRVRYVAEDPRAAPPAPAGGPEKPSAPADQRSVAIAWGKPAAAPLLPNQDDVVPALACGVLYVFDPQGKLLWTWRLGVDSCRVPNRIGRTASGPAALVAVSSEENALLAFEASAEGRLLWRYAVGQDIAAPLCVVPRRTGPNEPVRYCGLLPTADGEIHVLELVLGKRLGRFVVGHPMTVGGTYDPATGLAYFPADAKRIFAIDPAAIDDPQRPPCRSVLFTHHASGALRAGPAVVGQYLAVAESADLEHTSLRVFQLGPKGFGRPAAAPLKQLQLRGWAWFRPHVSPDRITLVTDQGDLGIFGLNLDNVEEAIYPIVQDGPYRATVALDTQDRARTLVVDAAEDLLWIMAGGKLRKLAVDVIGQRVRPLWPPRSAEIGATGIPVHEAQTDRMGRVLFLTTMSPTGRSYLAAAIDAQTGQRHWLCQLGLLPAADPMTWSGQVVLIDRSGQKLSLPLGAALGRGDQPPMLQMPPRGPLPDGADESRMLVLGDLPGPIHVIVPVENGAKLAVSTIRDPEAEGTPWTVVPLPDRLHGEPCLGGDSLVVPCADGQIYRVRLDGAAPPAKSEVTFTWSRSKPPGPVGAELYPLGPQAVLVVDERSRLRRIELSTRDLVSRWTEVGAAFHVPGAIQGRPLVVGQRIFVFDASGNLFCLNARNPNQALQPPLATGLKITAGPLLRGKFLVAVAEERKLVGIPLEGSGGRKAAASPAFWVAEETLPGRIRGAPSLAGDMLLVADNGRQVTGIGLADGKTRWKVPLGLRVGPAAAPVPFGPARILLPLADGTLLVVPQPAPQLAEVPR